MVYYSRGGPDYDIDPTQLRKAVFEVLEALGPRKKVLVIPPDFTRYHSQAGLITEYIWNYYGKALSAVLPALGTHAPMSATEIARMFGALPAYLIKVHNWRTDVVTLGEVPASFIQEVSEGRVDYSWPAQVNRLLIEGGFDCILSVGQVVPHEVVGMANYNKNIFIGTGGKDSINRSHFLGAAYGMERMMGRADTPVRKLLNYASEHFISNLPVVYLLNVIGRGEDDSLKMRGLFAGDDSECFEQAADLSIKVNFSMLDEPLKKVVVYLDPHEYKSTWLGNKSIYRTRMAIADGGELIVLAPGLKEFGEDPEIDRLIRKYGYINTENILRLTRENSELRDNLSAAAHLIHGSTENRFHITYCTSILTQKEVESVNFGYAPLGNMLKKYKPEELKEGANIMPGGEEVFYISNPALGLWSTRDRFEPGSKP